MVIDLSPIIAFFQLPGDEALRIFLVNFGWMPVAFTLLWGGIELWKFYRESIFDAAARYMFLAIDIPRGNEQSPKAVENMFSYFGGAHSTLNLIDKYWRGKFQLGFSFEIVSIDGYTQFIIRTPADFRYLVESAIYSQYPDAEITEVNDYTVGLPRKFPDKEWDLWGTEFIPVKPDAYPIKTYLDFADEFQGRPGTQFKDPMASLMDLMSSLKPGEQLWYQLLVLPTDIPWVGDRENEVAKILKEKVAKKSGLVDKLFDAPFWLFDALLGLFDASFNLSGGDASAEPEPLKMLQLKPNDKKRVESIHRKFSKQAFMCKQRMIYIARREVINKPKVVNGFVGYIKQYVDVVLNNFKPDLSVTGTSTDYFFKDVRLNDRKRKIMSGYRNRSFSTGRTLFALNIEELATLWHFPVETVVKGPLLQKAPGRKSEPPMTLPLDDDLPSVRAGAPPAEDIFTTDQIRRLDEPSARTPAAPDISVRVPAEPAITESIFAADLSDESIVAPVRPKSQGLVGASAVSESIRGNGERPAPVDLRKASPAKPEANVPDNLPFA